jgi:ABC-type transport system substrate-binding protein
VIWNLDKVLNDKAAQFDKRQSAQVKTRLPSVASYAKIDNSTVEITTKTVDSFFPYQMLIVDDAVWSRSNSAVIAGLDPAIHPLWEEALFADGCAGQARA